MGRATMTEGISHLETPASAYATAVEPIKDVKVLVRIWLERHLVLYGDRYRKSDGSYSDLFVDFNEVGSFLTGSLGDDTSRASLMQQLDEQESRWRQHMLQRTRMTSEAGGALPFEELRAAFDLSDDLLVDVIMALLVVEVDPAFLRAYAYGWCDFTLKDVRLGFLTELVGRTSEQREQIGQFFIARRHPLLRLRAVEVSPPAPPGGRGLMQRVVRLDDRLVQFLCGHADPGPDILGLHGRLSRSSRSLDSVLLTDELRRSFLAAFRRVIAGTGRLLLFGPDGVGKRSMCHAAVSSAGQPLLMADCSDLPRDARACEDSLLAFFREARLQNAVPLLAGIQLLQPADDDPSEGRLRALESACAAFPRPLLLTASRRIPQLADALPAFAELHVPHPRAEIQRKLWELAMPGAEYVEGFGIQDITNRYALTGGTIRKVARALEAIGAGDVKRPLKPETVIPLIRERLQHRLGALALPVERGFEWDDLVVRDRAMASLRELASYVRNRERIVSSWGFGAKLASSVGVAALFFGPPGTGKTMAASILAADLGMELFQIDLSRVVDKYVGQTEKNLSRVFDEGGRAQAMLLFDEADSLFAKRTSVSSSIDRYANLEVNFLLQQIERYDGVSILTTNFAEVIDDAFKRRVRFKVEFAFPEFDERLRLWQRMIPAAAPVADDVDFEMLAEAYELTGAHIHNVLLRAAAIAAHEEGQLTMDVIKRAADREYAGMGKLIRDSLEPPRPRGG